MTGSLRLLGHGSAEHTAPRHITSDAIAASRSVAIMENYLDKVYRAVRTCKLLCPACKLERAQTVQGDH